MPFFLKPCLKLRRKKNKKKSKLEDKIQRVSDVTIPVSTEEIWLESEFGSSTTSNLSDRRDYYQSDLNRTKCLARPTISEVDEISADVCTAGQSKDVSSQNTCRADSDENMSLKSDEQSEKVCLKEENDIQVNIDIERKEAPMNLQTVSDNQVGDITKTEKITLKEGAEILDDPLKEETFSEPNYLRFPDLNKIDVNMDVMKKIEELISIRNTFTQGDQKTSENIVEKNNKNISEEFLYTDNKNAESLIKYLNSQEDKIKDVCSNIKTKRNSFTCGTFKDKIDYDTKSKENLKETSSEYVNSKGNENFTALKQSRTDRSIDICNEKSSLNSTKPSENASETQEVDTQKNNACLNIKNDLNNNHSIIDATEHSDRSVHETSSVNSIKISSDKENTFTREAYDYLQSKHLRNKSESKTLCLKEMETSYFDPNATADSSASFSKNEKAFISEGTSSSTGSHSEINISRKIKENVISDKDCDDHEIKLVDNEIRNVFISENNNEEYEIKDMSIEVDFSDSHQCNLDVRSAHPKEVQVGENQLNEAQEKVELQNTVKHYEIKREEGKNQHHMVGGDEQFSPGGKKYSHLTFQENDLFTQKNGRHLRLSFENVNSLNLNENSFSKEYISLDLEEGSNFESRRNDCPHLKNDEYEEHLLHLKDDFKQEENIGKGNEKFRDKGTDINSFPVKTRNSAFGKTNISHDISSNFNKEINENKPYEEMQAKHKYFSVEGENLCSSTKNGDNMFFDINLSSKVLKKSSEEDIEHADDLSFKNVEDFLLHSDVNSSCCEIILPNTAKVKEDLQLQSFTKYSEDTNFLDDEDNYSARNLSRMYNDVLNNHHDNKLYQNENVEKVHGNENINVYDNETCECQIEDTFESENTNSKEAKCNAVLENHESSVLNVMYEKYYAFQNKQSPKRLNRFSNISSTSESSLSSIFSDKSCSKATDAKKKESRSFSISACGDSRNNEKIDEPIDDIKLSETVNDMIRFKEAKKAVSRNECLGIIREPKLTINVTPKNKNNRIKVTQNSIINQSGDHFEKMFKSIGLSGIDRIRESIEVFNKKKKQALSDMKPNVRTIPVKKTDVSKIRNKTEKPCRHQKARSPFLKVNPNSNLNGHERNLKELMPESLFKINKNVERHQDLHQKYNVGELFRKNSPDTSPTSESETESSRTSENISPARKHILNASRDIRSPKYPFKTLRRLPEGISHYIKRPVLIKSPKVNLVAYLTKDEKNRYILKKGYRMYNQECGNFQIVPPDYRRSDNKTDHIANAFNNRSTSPDYLKPKFDDMFKRYARKGRSNGELISYKRSTEWLRDAGIIGKSLTVEEANNAFKCTAGVKVALNKGDYRHYLKKLARIKRLNYNEIYKSLCSLSNRFVE